MNEIPIMLKINQAAEKFNLSKHFCRQLVLEKKVKYVMSGNRYLINEKSLCDYLNGESGNVGDIPVGSRQPIHRIS